MKPIYPIALLALAIGAWQFLPRDTPKPVSTRDAKTAAKLKNANAQNANPQKTLPNNAPLWEHAARAIKNETADWKLPKVDVPKVDVPKIELPDVVIEGWPGDVSVKKTAQVTSGQQLSRYEKILCDLANRERKERGLKPLKISPALADVARAHSREMAQKAYFAHESPDPKRRTTMDRYRLKFKDTPRLVAENIYKLEGPSFYQLSEKDFRRAHTGWMNSPGHRANILRDSPAGGPTEIGVGIVVRNGSFWATQNFARP